MEYDHWPKDDGKVTEKKMDKWKLWSDRVAMWRIIPRVFISLYGVMCYNAADWFMALPDPTIPQVTFVSTIWGAAAGWFGFYVNSGNKVTVVTTDKKD